MNQEAITIGSTESFYKYLTEHKGQVVRESRTGYYHVDVVADAYHQGFKDGKESGKKDYLEEINKNRLDKFVQRATQVYLLTKNVVSYLEQHKFPVVSIYLDILANCPRVIISVSNNQLNNDEFVELAYTKLFEMKRIFCNLFDSNLDMGLISCENLNTELLIKDGFGYLENLSTK
jgi:hypothetical protein